MTVIDVELATINNADPLNIVCVCTNNVHFEGFIPVDIFGTPLIADPLTTDEAEGWRHMPEDASEVCLMCAECGRTYKNSAALRTNPTGEDVIKVAMMFSDRERENIVSLYWSLV